MPMKEMSWGGGQMMQMDSWGGGGMDMGSSWGGSSGGMCSLEDFEMIPLARLTS